MNNELFNQARAKYQAQDYQGSLAAYTQCLQESANMFCPGEMGLLYHQIGNCLVKLKNPTEAIQAYSQATADATYDAVGAVNCNLGMAYAALHDYENAVRCFEVAVSDAKYDAPHKAYSGMGNALMKLGKSAEAGVAFREAALCESNPDPTKALLNLGVCFMALNRPADAVASYESALQFDMTPATRNKLFANLGQAYVATGQMQNAVDAFEKSLADKTYFLSDSASVDYQRAIGAVSQGTADMTQVLPALADMSGLDVAADGSPMSAYAPEREMVYAQPQNAYTEQMAMQPAQQQMMGGYPTGEDRFFNASEEELEAWSKSMEKGRKPRRVGLKIFIVFLILLVLALGAAVFAYTQGYGYPTQETVVQQLFENPDNAVSAGLFVEDIGADRAATMLEPMVQDANVTVDGVNRSMTDSTVFATATTEEGGSVQYKVSMVRDMLGWKVSGIELYFASQN